MSIIEGSRDRISQSQEKVQLEEAIRQRERELRRRIAEIEAFPGNLEEFNAMTGALYEIIAVPNRNRFLEGGIMQWETVDLDPDDGRPVRITDLLNPRNWTKISMSSRQAPGFYSEIRAMAVELGADALIHYKKEFDPFTSRPVVEFGVPVKKIKSTSE